MQRKGAKEAKAAAPRTEGEAPPAGPRQKSPDASSPDEGALTSDNPQSREPRRAHVHVPKMSPLQPDSRRQGTRPEEPRRPAPIIEMQTGNEPEHRHFPRARLATRFEIWREEGGQRTFSATLLSQNVSVSGAFLESTFFLPMGTEVQVRFTLEEGAEPVLARAEIIREEREAPGGRSGFGIRFVEFTGQTEVSLARLFLGMRLRTFAEEYLQSRRARSLPNELERVVDVLAAWELLKATSPGDPWQGQ
jgi:hypothetical protein